LGFWVKGRGKGHGGPAETCRRRRRRLPRLPAGDVVAVEQWLRAGGDPNAVHKSLKSTALQAAARGDHVECLEVGAAALLLRVCQPSRQPMPMLCSDPLNPAKHLRRCIKKYFSNGCMYGSHGGMRRACDWLASQLAAIRMEHTTCPSSRVLTTPCPPAPCSCPCAYALPPCCLSSHFTFFTCGSSRTLAVSHRNLL